MRSHTRIIGAIVGLGLLIQSTPQGYAQRQTILSFSNASAPDFSPIPIGTNTGGGNGTYMDHQILLPYHKGKAQTSLAITSPTWISVSGNAYIGDVSFIIDPGDSLSFVLKARPEGGYYLSVAGNKSELQEKILTHQWLDPRAYKIPNVLRKEFDYDQARNILREYFDGILSKADSLAALTNDHYRTRLTQELEQVFLTSLALRLPRSHKVSSKLLEEAFRWWDPFEAKYKDTRYGFVNREIHLCLMHSANKSVSIPSHDLGLWPGSLSYRNYLSTEDQAHLYATEMAQDYYTSKQWDRERYRTRLRFFADIFPDSPYYTYLDKLLIDRTDTDNAYIFGEYIPQADRFNYINRYPSKDIQEVIRKEFKGVPVVVDVWATYCSPCKTEFPYSASLHKWLAEKGIEYLYVSLDKAVNSAKWYANIRQFGLGGYHYLLTLKGRDSLAQQLSSYLTTPRYILFDEKGELVDDKLPRPSEKDNALVQRIREWINKGRILSSER